MDRGDKQSCAGKSEGRNANCEPTAEIIDLSTLPVGARPIPFAPLEFEEVPNARALDCPGYGHCLEFVAHVRWTGFSCRRCPHNQWSEGVAAMAGSAGGAAGPSNGVPAPIIRLR